MAVIYGWLDNYYALSNCVTYLVWQTHADAVSEGKICTDYIHDARNIKKYGND